MTTITTTTITASNATLSVGTTPISTNANARVSVQIPTFYAHYEIRMSTQDSKLRATDDILVELMYKPDDCISLTKRQIINLIYDSLFNLQDDDDCVWLGDWVCRDDPDASNVIINYYVSIIFPIRILKNQTFARMLKRLYEDGVDEFDVTNITKGIPDIKFYNTGHFFDVDYR